MRAFRKNVLPYCAQLLGATTERFRAEARFALRAMPSLGNGMIAKITDDGMDDPDARLMIRVREGDRHAFDELMRRYEPRVRGFVTKLIGSDVDADDITQQVFLRVFRARDGYEPTAGFSAWIFTIARNVVSNVRRGLSRRRETTVWAPINGERDLRELSLSSRDPAPYDSIKREEIREEVRAAIEQLCNRQQQAIRLICLQGCSYRDAGRQMKITVTAMKSLVCRARLNLKGVLKSRVA